MWFPPVAPLCCLSGCLNHIQAGLDDLLIAEFPNFRATWLSTHNFRADETQRHLTWWWGLDCGCHLTARNLASWPQNHKASVWPCEYPSHMPSCHCCQAELQSRCWWPVEHPEEGWSSRSHLKEQACYSFLIHTPHCCLIQRQRDLKESTKEGWRIVGITILLMSWEEPDDNSGGNSLSHWLYDNINVTSSSPRPQSDLFYLG